MTSKLQTTTILAQFVCHLAMLKGVQWCQYWQSHNEVTKMWKMKLCTADKGMINQSIIQIRTF